MPEGVKLDKLDVIAITVVVALYVVLPLLLFLLVVAGYGILSSALRYAAWGRDVDLFYALLWSGVAAADLAIVVKLVKWYKS